MKAFGWMLLGAVAAVVLPMLYVYGPEWTLFVLYCALTNCRVT